VEEEEEEEDGEGRGEGGVVLRDTCKSVIRLYDIFHLSEIRPYAYNAY